MKNVEVLIIGGGQAGLGMGYYLHQSNLSFLILDASTRTGDSWRQRWDSLELFTPRPFAALPGMKVPDSYHYYPHKDEIADYFASYAKEFELPVINNCTVSRLDKDGDEFVVSASSGIFHAKQVVIASGPYNKPNIPECAVGLGKDIWQLHSSQYKNLAQVPKGDVLVVGGGNSGAQLAVELSKSHNVTIATSGEPWFLPASIFGISLYWYIHLTGILSAKKNARVSRYVRSRGDGIVGQELQKLVKQGVIQLIPSKLSGCKDDMAYFENGEQLNVKNILWTTGFKPNYEWIGIKGVTNDAGQPIHGQGISPISGLYWLGLPWQTRLNSAIINGVKKDAKFIADSILSKLL